MLFDKENWYFSRIRWEKPEFMRKYMKIRLGKNTNEERCMLDKRVGERIRFLRESNDYTRDDLASRAHISSKFLYEIEMGRKGFSAEVLLDISKVLSVSCDYLLTGRRNSSGNTEKAAIILESIDPWQMGKVEDILRLIQEISRGSMYNQREINGAD